MGMKLYCSVENGRFEFTMFFNLTLTIEGVWAGESERRIGVAFSRPRGSHELVNISERINTKLNFTQTRYFIKISRKLTLGDHTLNSHDLRG